MKIFFYKYNLDQPKTTDSRKQKQIDFDNILTFATIISCCFLFIIQILLTNQFFRVFLNNRISRYEGRVLEVENNLYRSVNVELELIDFFPNNNVYIRVNGEKVARFDNPRVMLNVKEDDIIQIDCTSSKGEFIVEVKQINGRINMLFVQKRIKINNEIATIARINW